MITIGTPTRTPPLRLGSLGWIGAALGIALFTATQPLPVVAAGLALIAFGLLALITPLAAVLALLTLAPLRTLIATEAPWPLPLDIGQLSLVAVIAVWVAYRVVHQQRLPRLVWSPIYAPVLVFFSVAGMSAFDAVSLGAWINEWLKWAQIVVLIALVLDLAVGRAWEWLVFGLIAAGVANAVIGIYEFFGGSGALHLLVNERFFRAFGTFGQPNPFGGFMGLLAPLAITMALGYGWRVCLSLRTAYQSIRSADVLWAGFYGVAAGLIGVAALLSWSRGAWLGLAVALMVVVFALPRRIWQGIGLVAVITVLGGGLWLSGRLPASIVDRVNSAAVESFAFTDVRGVNITPENYALIERFAHWQAAINMATARPWLGVGFGNYEAAYADHHVLNWELALGHAHNYYLNILAETGVIGLAAYLVLWGSLGVMTWRTRRHPDIIARLTSVGLLGTWAYLSVHSLTDNLYVNNLFLHLGVMLGLLAVLHRQTFRQVLSSGHHRRVT
ncbi:MAG: hypothetical protein GYB67_03485 [Chloroflexi bacterium]|nr:hypothetical protein [Chloroflexota bacterium]